MKFIDMLRMSISNLWKRKLRTLLTILGVIIGTTSIVVMVSIGIGLDKSTMEEIESMSSLSQIQVSPSYETSNLEDLFFTDKDIESFKEFNHVDWVSPVLCYSCIVKVGKYRGYLDLLAYNDEYIKGLDLQSDHIPSSSDKDLILYWGPFVWTNFHDEKSGDYLWAADEAPFDIQKDKIYYILDSDTYFKIANGSATDENGVAIQPPKKYCFETYGECVPIASGVYKSNSFDVICNVDALQSKLKNIYRNEPIPGQPVTKAGKPSNNWYYDSVIINVDDTEYINDVISQIRAEGYNCYSEMEYLEEFKKEALLIEAALGGIGAISMLVAAISIANTMMMSIYERTKEIGIMKVLGCNIRNIQAMFLTESGSIGFIGGSLGIVFSFLISTVANKLLYDMAGANISYIPLWLAALSLLFATLVSVIAGFFPSRHAMKLSPLAAIHNE